MMKSATLLLSGFLLCFGFTCLDAATEADARSFVDDLEREVEIPDNPARIVSLHDIDLTIPLIELGVTPVASHGRMGLDGKPYIRAGALLTGVDFDNSEIAYVGSSDIDLEAVAGTRPDLIITAAVRSTPVETLSSIAPTIVLDGQRYGATHIYKRLSEITGTRKRFEILENRYQTAIRQLKALAHPEEITVNVLQPNRGKINLYYSYRSLGKVLRDAGFKFPPITDAIGEGNRILVGIERLPELDADYIFNPYRSDRGSGAEADIASMEAIMPNFCSFLSACREGRYVMVAREEAISASYASLMLMVSMVQSHVVKGPQPD